jgi:hypothetical protein
VAVAFFAEPPAATPPSRLRRKKNSRNLLCLQFAARLLSAVNVRTGRIRRTRLKLFTWFRILRRPVRQSRRVSSRMLCKCLSTRRISRATELPALPCGSSASSRTLFRFVGALRDANCLTLAARRLKFAARLVDPR